MAQVSTNILDFDETPIYKVFEECKNDADTLKLGLTGSELVGLVPLKALLDCAEYYCKKDGLFVLEEDQRIRLVVDRLGLSSIKYFKPEERVIEYMVGSNKPGQLASLSVVDFVKKVASRTAVPGGGSVSALVGALGTSLASMAGLLTFGNRKFEKVDGQMREIIPKFYNKVENILRVIDADSDAFAEYVDANREMNRVKYSKDQNLVAKAKERLDNSSMKSVQVPLRLVLTLDTLWQPLVELAKYVNPATLSDVTVAGHCLAAGIHGAYANVKINLPNLPESKRDGVFEDELYKAKTANDNVEANLANVMKVLNASE